MNQNLEHLKSRLSISLEQHSEAGIKDQNQDTIGARIPEGSSLISKGIAIAVADGVSTSSSARQASQLAISGFLNDYYATPDTWRTQKSAVQVIQSLNRYLWAQSQNSVRQEGHLTTFSAIVLKGDTVFTFHVGDSRIYRFRNENLELLTRDHTQVIDKNTHYLSRALGADPILEIDKLSQEFEVGDLYLLTTDGIHSFIPHSLLAEIVKKHQHDLSTLIQEAVQTAKQRQSDDNISIQVCKIEQKGPATQSDAVAALSQLPFPPLLSEGQTLDSLTVKKIIHESERSQVYVVEAPGGKKYVMKTPSINYEDDPAYIERFVLESWIGARIQNSNVVRVIEPPCARTFLYYLTEYVTGPSLGQLIRERAPFNIQDAIELLEQMIRGTRAFHRRDTLHQDIKPENIIIGSQGATLIDFGSCWVAGIDEVKAPFQRDSILGTLDYSAPEYRFGGPKSQRSDQFSLAVIFYEMITGHKPYGAAYAETNNIKSFQKLHYISAARYNPLVPFWLDKAIEKAVSIHPNSRYTSLSEWLQDIKRPNPSWTTARDMPFIERNPVRFWQSIALIGWLVSTVLAVIQLL